VQVARVLARLWQRGAGTPGPTLPAGADESRQYSLNVA